MCKTINEIRNNLEQMKTRSAWDNGVKLYAFDLCDTLEDWLDVQKRALFQAFLMLKKAINN